jgi:hypothetical protein
MLARIASKKSPTSPRPVIHSFYRFSHAQPSEIPDEAATLLLIDPLTKQ